MIWMDVKEKAIPINEYVLAGLFLSDGSFECAVIKRTETDELFDSNGELYFGWGLEFFEYWLPIIIPSNKEY